MTIISYDGREETLHDRNSRMKDLENINKKILKCVIIIYNIIDFRSNIISSFS